MNTPDSDDVAHRGVRGRPADPPASAHSRRRLSADSAADLPAPEDTRKTGVKPDDIKAGVRPDYTKLRDRLVVIPVQGRIHMIGGAGATSPCRSATKGTLLVDTGDAAAADKVIAEIKKLADQPGALDHQHHADLDHTGGNGMIAKAGVGSTRRAVAAAPAVEAVVARSSATAPA